jgi:rod shape-determining protein MreD
MMVPRVSTLALIGRFAVALVGVVVVQGILAAKFNFFGYLDLPLICSVYYGFTLGNPIASIFIGSALGLMQDGLSGSVLGTNGFSKTLLGFMAASAGSRFNVDQPITRVFALFLFTLVDGLLVSMLGLMVTPVTETSYSGTLGGWLLSATLNTLLGLSFFEYHDRLRNATTGRV